MAPMIVGMGTQPKDGDKTGATIDDGPRWVEEYNGIKTEINKDGEYSLVAKGGELDMENNTFTPAEGTELSSIVLDKNKKITILAGDGTSAVLDGSSDSVTISTSGGLSIEISASGININADSGNVTVAANQINLNSGMVNVGEGASFKATIFENLKAAFEGHIHQVPQAMAGILPSQPPIQPLLPSVGSNTVKISE